MLRALPRPFALLLRLLLCVVLAATGLAVATATASSEAANAIYIDAGGQGGTDVDGHVWLSDRYYVGGQAMATKEPVEGTRYQGVFQDWRRDVTAYRVPVTNGSYWVKLLESESYWESPGKRIFDVRAEGTVVLDNVDLFARAGGAGEAVYLVFKTTVSDGRLDLDFTASEDVAKLDGLVIEPADGSAAGETPTPVPTGNVMWGMADTDNFDSLETNLGRKFALVREYRRIDQTFLNQRMKSLAAGGRSLVLSIANRNETRYLPYADIAAGKYDTAFLNGWASLQDLPTKTYFIFAHEADSTDAKASCTNPTDSICGPQFVAAWRHLYNLAKSRYFPKVVFAWTVTSYGFNPYSKVRNNYYWPGAGYTDWVGVDTYSGGCNSDWWGELDEMMAYSIDWLNEKAPNKPIILPEYGAVEGNTATAKANFFYNLDDHLSQPGYDRIRGLLYWNERPEPDCDYRIGTSAASYNAFKAVGLSPAMNGKAG